MKKPCIDVCRYDKDTGWCLGCGLAKAERKRWKKLDAAVQTAAVTELPGRLAALAAAGHRTGKSAKKA